MTSRWLRLAGVQLFVAAAASAQSLPERALPLEVVVREARPLAPSRSETRIGAEEGRRAAGTQGDMVKTLQALPGLARSGAGAGEIVAWGSAPRETRVYVDGVELPVLYHGSGIRSVLPSDWVSQLSFVPGAYGPDHGRGLGGLVTLGTRSLDPDRWRASAQVDLLDASLGASVPLRPGLVVAAAGRYGWVDRWSSQLASADVGSLLSVPSYRDGQVRLGAELDSDRRVDLVYIGSRDELRREVPSSDRQVHTTDTRELAFSRWYVRYLREAPGDRVEVTPFVGVDHSVALQSGAGGRSSLDVRSVPYGLRASETLTPGDDLSVRLGVDAKGVASEVRREGSLTLPPREGDPFVLGQVPSSENPIDQFSVHIIDVAPYAEVTLRLGRFELSPGLRVDTYLIESDRVRPPAGRAPPIGRSRADVAIEPRLALSHDLGQSTRLLAAAGIYHQAPDPEDLSATFGNPELGLARSFQLSVGEQVRFDPTLMLELSAYYKGLDQLAARSTRSTPNTAEVLESNGKGRAFGVQVLVRQTWRSGFSGWLAATLSRSERARDGGGYRLFDYDQPLVVSAVVNQRAGDWSFGARLRSASGSPRTPVLGASYNLQNGLYEPTFGAVNATRLPAFFQLDLRVDRRFSLGESTSLYLYVDALNVTATQNAEELVYSADYREHDYLLGLPTLIVAGVRLER